MASIVPDIASLRASVKRDDVPPSELPPALQSLWLMAKAGGKPTQQAHAALTGTDKRNIAWVRAHLCRAGGESAKAKRLYTAAGRPVPADSMELHEEWGRIATTLLGDMLQRGLADTRDEAEAAAAAAAHITDPVAYLEALGMRSIPHGSRQANLDNGTFMDHLCGVESAMRRWGLPESLCLAGLYFAKEPGYSDIYATKPDGMNGLEPDESEFMLATVSIGDVIEMDRDLSQEMSSACNDLVTPPLISSFTASNSQPSTSDGVDAATAPPTPLVDSNTQRYNTVRGYTQTDLRQQNGSWTKNPKCPRSLVWIVYENGRAYPHYLVRYMRGKRDPNRTPYDSREEAMRAARGASGRGVRRAPPRLRGSLHLANQTQSLSGTPTNEVQWTCQTDDGEVAYVAEINARLEEAFYNGRQQGVSFNGRDGRDGFEYVVNVEERTQVNRTTGTRRAIFRYVNGHPSGWITNLDPQSQRYYFVNKYDRSSGSTWQRNMLCPSVPFQLDDAVSNPVYAQ